MAQDQLEHPPQVGLAADLAGDLRKRLEAQHAARQPCVRALELAGVQGERVLRAPAGGDVGAQLVGEAPTIPPTTTNTAAREA